MPKRTFYKVNLIFEYRKLIVYSTLSGNEQQYIAELRICLPCPFKPTSRSFQETDRATPTQSESIVLQWIDSYWCTKLKTALSNLIVETLQLDGRTLLSVLTMIQPKSTIY
jgi:hypothetical protein